MKNIFNKTNAPYLAGGVLATLTLLASGVFALAPYVGFLAPVAALSVGLPFVIGGAVFSVVTIALSYKAISEKDTQLADEKSKVEGKNSEISRLRGQLADEKAKAQTQKQTISEKEAEVKAQKQTISEKEAEVKAQKQTISKKEAEVEAQKQIISKKEAEVEAQKQIISKKEAEVEAQKQIISEKEAQLADEESKVEITGGTVQLAKGALNSVGNGVKNACGTLAEYPTKETLDNVGSDVKNACGTVEYSIGAFNKLCGAMLSAESVSGLVPSLKVGIAGLVGVGGVAYIAVNGGFTVADNSSNAVGNSTNSTESGASIPNSSSVYYRPTCQQIMQSKVDETSKKLADAEEFAKNNFGMSEEDNANNKNESQSVVSKILSISRNLWGSISNFISGSNKDAHNHSEPQCKDLHKSEDLEEIIDGGTLPSLFRNDKCYCPGDDINDDKCYHPEGDINVNHTYSNNTIASNYQFTKQNGINTSKQQGTFVDFVNLKKLNEELHSSTNSTTPPS